MEKSGCWVVNYEDARAVHVSCESILPTLFRTRAENRHNAPRFVRKVDTVIVVSRDTDFKPVLEIAAKRGLRTVAVAPGTHGRSDALRNAAHHEITLE